MKKILFLCFLAINSYSQEIVTLDQEDIYGCFKQISNSKYEYTILLSRKNLFETSNSKTNTILMMSKYTPVAGGGNFFMSPLQFEGTTFFRESKDNWNPVVPMKTFFTAKGNLDAFSMQYDNNSKITTATFSQFEKGEIKLECTANKEFIEDLHFQLLVD